VEQVFPASGKKRGSAYLSTPNVAMIFCVAGAKRYSASAFAPSTLSPLNFFGLTVMT